MNIDGTVKALRGECKALCKDGLGKNCLGCEYIGEELMHPCYRCNLQSIAADQLEQLQAENERLKAEKPVRCGECEYYEHSDEKGVFSHCGYYGGVLISINKENGLELTDYCSYGKRRDAE